MRWKTTWLLLLGAAALFSFIFFFERYLGGTSAIGKPPTPLLAFAPAEITTVQIRRTNQFILKAERDKQSWNIVSPINYSAQGMAIDHLLKSLAETISLNSISLKELNEQRRSIAEFGLDAPSATLVLVGKDGKERREIIFGAKTPLGDRVYVQTPLTSPDIFTVNAELFDRIPLSVHQWRDIALVNLEGLNADRMEIRTPLRSFTIVRTNGAYVITKPTPARANPAKMDQLLRQIQQEPVRQFVNDDPRAELEPFGLQPPVAEVVFGNGTNDLAVVQFGKSPAEGFVYARRLVNTNIVLVATSLLESILVPPSELRDPHLLAFAPGAVDTVEVNGPEKFTVSLQASNRWVVTGSPTMTADPELVREWLARLGALEGNVEKDVVTVTDLANYGLQPPFRQYILKSSSNGGGNSVSNRVLAQLDLSTKQENKIFARSGDESVYWIKPADFDPLPTEAWQLRDRRVWTFTTNQVSRVSIRQKGYTRQLLRGPNGKWELERGSQGMIEPARIEEIIYRLGDLRAAVWVARSGANRLLYGFTDIGHQITIELKNGDKPQVLTLEFGDLAPSQFPYALATTADGQSMVFEFPLALYIEVVRALSNSPMRPPTATPK